MLTGQGTPTGVLPWYTKVIVMLTAVFSVPIFVIPSSMLTWGFEAEAERLMRKKREARKKVKLAERCGTRVDSSSSSEEDNIFESDDEEATWDEYERVVLGEDDDDANNEESKLSEEDKKLLQDVSKYFAKADVDADGTLSMLEFFEFARSQRGKASPETAAFRDNNTPQVQHLENRLNRMEEKLDQLLIAVQPKSGKR